MFGSLAFIDLGNYSANVGYFVAHNKKKLRTHYGGARLCIKLTRTP
jgi:hypothetical protein